MEGSKDDDSGGRSASEAEDRLRSDDNDRLRRDEANADCDSDDSDCDSGDSDCDSDPDSVTVDSSASESTHTSSVSGGGGGSSLDYLFDRSALGQHAVAVAVAVMATAVGYAKINGLDVSTAFMSAPGAGLFGTKGATAGATQSGGHQHHRTYRRTAGLRFCPFDAPHSEEERVRRILQGDDGNDYGEGGDVCAVDPHLRPFDFHLPSDLADALGAHYLADELRDDAYVGVLSALTGVSAREGGGGGGGTGGLGAVAAAEYRCLAEVAAQAEAGKGGTGNRVSVVSGTAVAYVQPDFSTFYPIDASASDSAAAQKEGKARERKRTPAHLSFTGFAAKFVNLSPKPVNLYWDGSSGALQGTRLVGLVRPYEAIGTATLPGQSFHVTPTYDKDHVLKRWTVTADEAVLAYDPYKNRDWTEEERTAKINRELTKEQRWRYRMQLLNLAYGRDYLVKTGRAWLGNFPRPLPYHPMWPAHHFGQRHSVATKEAHFVKMPPDDLLGELGYSDYEPRAARNIRAELAPFRRGAAMDLQLEVISCAPQVFRIDNFLSPVEMQHILDLARSGEKHGISLQPSTVHPGGAGDDFTRSGDSQEERNVRGAQTDRSTRSSTNAWVARGTSPIVDSIYRRAADLLRIDESLLRHRSEKEHMELATHHSIAEPMQLVRYAEGQEYTAHHDFLYPGALNRYQPGRFATVLLYLNDDGLEGGETVFPRAINAEMHDGIAVTPRAGTAVLFYNVLPDGNPDDLSQHASKPVVKGEKYLANLWVWDPIID